jgi:hypothetical protein
MGEDEETYKEIRPNIKFTQVDEHHEPMLHQNRMEE